VGGLFGIGGSSSKTDRSTTLKGYGALENVFNYAIPSGEAATDTSSAYFSKLLSGDRATAMQAIAPEANAAVAGSDAQKRQQSAMGTARGGGTAGGNQTRQQDVMAQIDNMLFGARSGAAGKLGAMGGQLLSTGGGAASDLLSSSIQSQQASDKKSEGLGSALGGLVGAALGFL